MTHEQIIQTLMKIRINARWTLNGDTFDDLIWLDEVQVKPTSEEIEQAIEEEES
ncbi:MAG: hypothetical protein AB7U85_02085 [Alphaproteobacteria bacterium]